MKQVDSEMAIWNLPEDKSILRRFQMKSPKRRAEKSSLEDGQIASPGEPYEFREEYIKIWNLREGLDGKG